MIKASQYSDNENEYDKTDTNDYDISQHGNFICLFFIIINYFV